MSPTTLAFAIGFAFGVIMTLLFQRARPLLKQIRENAKVKQEEVQVRKTTGLEDNHRRLTLRRAQGMHLAAPLFALNDVMLEPRLIAPPPQVIPGVVGNQEDTTSQTLPYMPDWPELAAIYRAPTLSIAEAAAGERNVVIVGAAGMGKTVALAHLASLAANLQVRLDSGKEAVPYLYHIADLQLPFDPNKDPLTILVNAVAERAPVFDARKLPEFIKHSFNTGSALLLLDGFDEADLQTQQNVVEWFKVLTEVYPKARIVTTGMVEQLTGLIDLEFSPFSMMAWSKYESSAFIQKWSGTWTQSIGHDENQPDAVLLNEWLETDNMGLSPFEMTLKVWAAYAGDSLGVRILDLIATHVRRIAPSGTPPAALELLAMQVTLTAQPVFDPRSARSWVKQYDIVDRPIESAEAMESDETSEEPVVDEKQKKRGKKSKAAAPSYGLLSKMVDSGLLTLYANEKMRFTHPIFGGYLAGQAIRDNDADTTLLAQPEWNGKALALHYFAARGDASAVADILLKESGLPLHAGTFVVARWLRDAPKEAKWRSKVFGGLFSILQAEGQPITLRARAVAAFVNSGDPGVTSLFRQLLTSRSFEIIPLAALGSGAIRDRKAIPMLEEVLQAPVSTVRRAACLALVAIGTDKSLEAVARALLEGDDELRRAAAQALANDPAAGYETLREGATLADIMVRRAVVHGLARIEEPWALETLQIMQVEDDQWAVRNLANQYVEEKSRPDPRVPGKLTPPSETSWLVEYAGKQGISIPRGSPATDALMYAFKNGSIEQRLAVIPYLKQNANEGVVGALYNTMYGDDPELREACYLAVQEIAANGMAVPHPNQFGLG